MKQQVYEIRDGHQDHVALVSDLSLAEELALAVWCGQVRPLLVDDDFGRKLLAEFKS